MSSVAHVQQVAKTKVSVSPVNWLPGSLSACLPFFAVPDPSSGILYFRGDDPNIYGVQIQGVQQNPVVEKNGVVKPGNKGCNFFSAPWCVPNYPARDVGKRVYIKSVDSSIMQYISALYSLIGVGAVPGTVVNLSSWKIEQPGYVKLYQIIQVGQYINVSGVVYFGAQGQGDTSINGVSSLTRVSQNLITDDFSYNGASVDAYQMPYNTFYAVDTPIVISAIDSANPQSPRLYFTLFNNAVILGNINYPN